MKRSVKRPLSIDTPSLRYGIYLAATVAADYDKYSSHPFLVSDCVLAKLNVIKGKPRRNKAAAKLRALLSSIEGKVASVEAMTRFMHGMALRKRS